MIHKTKQILIEKETNETISKRCIFGKWFVSFGFHWKYGKIISNDIEYLVAHKLEVRNV